MATHHWIILLPLVACVAGCSGSGSSLSGSPGSPTVATPGSVSSLLPNVGSTGGTTQVRIAGAGLGTSVTFGGATATGHFDSRAPGSMIVSTPAHAAGTVDVVVSCPTGPPVTVTGGFTYASPLTFDFNGGWNGYGSGPEGMPILFSIQNNTLLSVTCQSTSDEPDTIVAFSPPRPIVNGEVSVAGDGVFFTARIVSPSTATGTINLGSCISDEWHASKL